MYLLLSPSPRKRRERGKEGKNKRKYRGEKRETKEKEVYYFSYLQPLQVREGEKVEEEKAMGNIEGKERNKPKGKN